jgi:hypothetical protein
VSRCTTAAAASARTSATASTAVTLDRVLIQSNGQWGVSANGCRVAIERSTIRYNGIGGISIDSDYVIRNTLIAGNATEEPLRATGGVWIRPGAQGVFEFNTVAGNVSINAGPGVSALPSTQPFTNSIVAGNRRFDLATRTYDDAARQFSGGTWSFSLFETGEAKLDRDYRPVAGSAAIDAADPAATLAVDRDGTARPAGAGRDIGAYEAAP